MKKTFLTLFWFPEARYKLLAQGLMFFVLLFGVYTLQAQSKHYFSGKMYIDTAGFIYISMHDTVILNGNNTTVREQTTTKRGMLSFADSTNWRSDNGSFVNGYVRSHKTGAFVFPVGQGIYRPAAVSKAADAAPTDVAYYNTAQFDKNALDADINEIRDETWFIIGATAAVISLSWSADISSFANSLTHIGIAGWDGTKWVKIASAVDAVSPIFGTSSDLSTNGSISTLSEITPNSYYAYTLAAVDCPELECDIALDLTVYLQGVTLPSGLMSNYLQTGLYSYTSNARLPKDDPYKPNGIVTTYPEILNTNGPAGNVVDWVLVEIWGDFTPGIPPITYYQLFESRALLLQTNGKVVDIEGNKPKFNFVDGTDIRVVVRHRNHLDVVSSELFSGTKDVTYDFTTAATKAVVSAMSQALPQEVSYGKYCMWAGDFDNNHQMNSLDATFFFSLYRYESFNDYILGDVTMDGIVNVDDDSFVTHNTKIGLFGPMRYFVKK